MLGSILLACFLLAFAPVGANATPVTFDGSFVTAFEEESGRNLYETFHPVAVDPSVRSIVSLSLEVSSAGGQYIPELNGMFFQTFVDAAVRMWNNSGDLIGEFFLGRSDSGWETQDYRLYNAILLDTVPSVVEFAMTGHDALIGWTLTVFPEDRHPVEYFASSDTVPEPGTMMTLALGGLMVAFQISRTRPLQTA